MLLASSQAASLPFSIRSTVSRPARTSTGRPRSVSVIGFSTAARHRSARVIGSVPKPPNKLSSLGEGCCSTSAAYSFSVSRTFLLLLPS